MALDERLRRELERAGRPADPSGVYEELIRRRERHRIARRLEAGALALVVFAATIGGFFGLTRVFRGTEEPPQILAPSVSNGLIVFSLPLKSGGEHLFGVAPDGSTLRQLTPEGNAVYRSPDVSPDGSTVVAVHEIEGFEAGQSVLVTVPITGGSPTWLSEASWVVLDPAWSPDGAQIAFAGSPGGPFGIYVFEVSTGDAQLVPGTDEIDVADPTWSPDGSRIAFEAWDGTQPEQWDIYSARLDGSELTNLTRTPDYSETMPAWSWTHDRIAFIESGPAEGALLTMSAAGTDQMTAYSGELSPANPVWSPNGTAIAFEGGSEGIFTVRADGTGPAPLPDARGREPAWQALIDGATLPPVMPTPAPSPDPDAQDIGLGFPVCNLSSIKGRFSSPDANSTIFVATRASDAGGCAQPEDAFNVVALDTDQDGLADISYGPIECTLECRAFSAPDVDGDGTDEFLVVQDGGAVVGLRLYDFSTNGQLAIVPVNVAGPGDPQGGFEPSQQAILWLGGDAFELYGLQCGEVPAPDGPGVIATAAESIPHDSPDAEWHAHQTTLVLRSDGLLHVVDVRDFTEPIAADPDGPSFRSGETLCGSNLGPAVPTP